MRKIIREEETMKKIVTATLGTATLGLALCAQAASAGGIDRSGQSIGALFEKGTYGELSFGYVSPSVSGSDVALFGGSPSGNTTADFTQLGAAYKQDFGQNLSFALIFDQPFGADITYPAPGGSIALGGTFAKVDSNALTGILRYKFNDRMSVYAGARADRASGTVHLSGAAYGPVSGYNVVLKDATGYGYVVGAAFEIPKIAMRVALTYNSAITHDFATVEGGGVVPPGTSTTSVKTPQSVNLDFQTGINPTTLVFGTIRWVKWSEFKVEPANFLATTHGGLVSIENATTYTLGVGHKFNDSWSGAATVSYEDAGNPLVSPLAPTSGRFGIGLAAIYTVGKAKITAGAQYIWLGDATPATGGTARANFTGNTATAVGVKIGYTF